MTLILSGIGILILADSFGFALLIAITLVFPANWQEWYWDHFPIHYIRWMFPLLFLIIFLAQLSQKYQKMRFYTLLSLSILLLTQTGVALGLDYWWNIPHPQKDIIEWTYPIVLYMIIIVEETLMVFLLPESDLA